VSNKMRNLLPMSKHDAAAPRAPFASTLTPEPPRSADDLEACNWQELAERAVRSVEAATYKAFVLSIEADSLASLPRSERGLAAAQASLAHVELISSLTSAGLLVDAADDAGAGDSTPLRLSLEGAWRDAAVAQGRIHCPGLR
jgi:hypothetical protein